MPRRLSSPSKSIGRLFKVGSYAFCAPDSVEGINRDFTIDVFSDHTCSWLDETTRQDLRANKLLEIHALCSVSANSELRDEENSFRFDGTICEEAYHLIVEK